MSQWVQGARPRTLPAAVSPVLVGTGIAVHERLFDVVAALLCLAVALALQIGVNYANDYSDGVRGTDQVRVGPVRLIGQGLASPAKVRAAAIACLLLGAVSGLALAVWTGAWWLIAVGAAAIAAAWLYTGGPRPYGYAGFGELFVFVFFGLVAVSGTALAQTGHLTWLSLVCSIAVGSLAVAVLVANNLRDIPGDSISGKRTLAVRLGAPATRQLYALLLGVPFLAALLIGLLGVSGITGAESGAWPLGALLALLALPLAVPPVRIVGTGAAGRDLIVVLAGTGRVLLGYSLLLSIGIGLAGS